MNHHDKLLLLQETCPNAVAIELAKADPTSQKTLPLPLWLARSEVEEYAKAEFFNMWQQKRFRIESAIETVWKSLAKNNIEALELPDLGDLV